MIKTFAIMNSFWNYRQERKAMKRIALIQQALFKKYGKEVAADLIEKARQALDEYLEVESGYYLGGKPESKIRSNIVLAANALAKALGIKAFFPTQNDARSFVEDKVTYY